MIDDPRLADLLLKWEELCEAGHDVDVAQLCSSCPELIDRFQDRIRAIQSMNALLLGDSGADTDGVMAEDRARSLSTREFASTTRYQIVRLHDRGGRGDVFLAVDEQFQRNVAIKMARNPVGGSARDDFYREARTTSHLDHPGIVPLYAVGEDSEGQPFYAMRFVQGETLWHAIERFYGIGDEQRETALDSQLARKFQQLIDRFVSVCNTIAYAHDRGWMHRDLKPQNILLGSYGETLVADWGLAKQVGQPEPTTSVETRGTPPEVTRSGTVKGTPGYMSPEQAAGDPSLIGRETDIYSLGATLYAILTGRAPIESTSFSEGLMRVRRGEFRLPRAVNRRAPAALESICLKAMATDPAQRFDSVQTLVRELENWRANEPISCHRESPVERTVRWSRRHRTSVVAAAVLLCTAVTALITGIILLNREKSKVELARADAEQSFEQARSVVDDYFSQVAGEELLDQPGLRPVRKRLLHRALDYYRDFLQSHGADPILRARIAQTHHNIGKIVSEVGDKAEALTAFQQALGIRRELLAESPDDADLQLGVARAIDVVASLLRELGKLEESREQYEESLRLKEQLVERSPASGQFRQSLAVAYHNQAALLAQLTRHEEAISRYDEARQLLLDLRQEQKGNPRVARELGLTYDNLGIAQWDMGRHEASFSSHQEAETLFRQLLELTPDSQTARHDLARTLRNLARRASELERTDQAAKFQVEATERFQSLVNENPEVTDFRSELAGMRTLQGDLHLAAGNQDLALGELRAALELQQQIVDLNQDVPAFQFNLAAGRMNVGMVLVSLERYEEALAELRTARDTFTALCSRSPDEPQMGYALASTYQVMGTLHERQEEWDLAAENFEFAAKSIDPLSVRYPHNPHYSALAGQSKLGLGTTLIRRDRLMEAKQVLLAATRYLAESLEQLPDSDDWRKELGRSYSQLSKALRDMRDYFGAIEAAVEAREVWSGRPNEQAQVVWEFARCAQLADRDQQLSEDQRTEIVRRCAVEATLTLNQARDAGLTNGAEFLEAPEMKVFGGKVW